MDTALQPEVFVKVIGTASRKLRNLESKKTTMQMLRLLSILCAVIIVVQSILLLNMVLLPAISLLLLVWMLIAREFVSKEMARKAEIEQLHARNLDIEKKLAESESLSQTKNQFLMNMSHEIRTPLSAILGFVDLIEDPNLPIEERREFSRIIRNNGEYLTKIVNDILDISQIENSKLTIRKTATKIKKVLSLVLAMMEIKAQEKGLKLTVEYWSDLPEVAFVDEVRFRQIIVNLVGNAIKFTKRGSVSLYVATYPSGVKEIVNLEVIVRDTGEGIPDAQKSHLFNMFSQVNTNNGSRPLGTGIGLTLSRRLAHLMGGDVALLESEPGSGSSFIFTMPIKVIIDGKIEGKPNGSLLKRRQSYSSSSAIF